MNKIKRIERLIKLILLIFIVVSVFCIILNFNYIFLSGDKFTKEYDFKLFATVMLLLQTANFYLFYKFISQFIKIESKKLELKKYKPIYIKYISRILIIMAILSTIYMCISYENGWGIMLNNFSFDTLILIFCYIFVYAAFKIIEVLFEFVINEKI